jgi:hypothetical protein
MKSNPKVLLTEVSIKLTEIQNVVSALAAKAFLNFCLSNDQILSVTNNCGSYGNLVAYDAQHAALGTYYGTCRVMTGKVYDIFASQQARKKGVVEQLTIVINDTPFYNGNVLSTHFLKNKNTFIYAYMKVRCC